MELRNELWIDLVGLTDTIWKENGCLAFSKDYSEKSQKSYDGVWLLNVRLCLRALGYKITKWKDLFETLAGDEYLNSTVIHTDCPFETYAEEGQGWNDWCDDIGEVVNMSSTESSSVVSSVESSADSDPE
jgi:hypothetical protein